MGTFWLIAAVMIAVALVLVLPPMLGRRRAATLSRTQLNVAVYRDRLEELEATRASGALDEESYTQARAELEGAMLADVDRGDESSDATPTAASPVAAVVIAVAVPLIAFGAYLQLGRLDALGGVERQQPPAHAGAGGGNMDSAAVEQMVARLKARLEKDPENAEGWITLARTYAFIHRDEDAQKAFARAVELAPDDTFALVGFAETLTRLADGQVPDRAVALLDKALANAPDLQPALWLAGMASFQRGDNAAALERWNRVREIGGLGPEATQLVEQFIVRAGGEPSKDSTASAPASVAAAAPAPAPAKGTDGATSAAAGSSVQVRVELDPAIASKASPNDVVFVFARAPSGPPMPLAVVRRTVADLPLTVTLDDGMAMMDQMKLSAFPEVVLGARVSKSGMPTPEAGDLEGSSDPIRVAGAGVVDVRIDQVVR